VYAVEVFTSRGGEILGAVSRDGGEAFSLCYTPTIEVFTHTRDGTVRCGFDMTVPKIRYGTDEHYFDSLMAYAGFLEPGPASPAAGARLVQRAFGVTLDPELLERPLPAAPLPSTGESL
jgi:hypothetical protein